MSFRRYNFIVIGALTALVPLFAAVNYAINVYGLFGDVRGRSYSVLGTERTGKYLFSLNYIPSNFDVLLVGSSISDNWDTSVLQLGRTYNASISGGNISEEALIAENVLQRRKLKAVLFIIFPYMTETFGRKSGFMTPQDYWSALGSVQLLGAYAAQWAIGRGLMREEFTPSGEFLFEVARTPHEIGGKLTKRSDFHVNELAFAEYRYLLAETRRNGARVVGIIPPVSKASLSVQGEVYERYNARVKALFLANETIIDLNQAPELMALRANPATFPDGSHLTTEAALQVVRVLDKRLR